MYASASEYLGLYKKPEAKLVRNGIFLPNGVSRKDYGGYLTEESYSAYNTELKQENPVENIENVEEKVPKWVVKFPSKFSPDPKSWGPVFWTTYHVSAAHYPENPSPIVKERMKNRILAIPYEIPCNNCRHHASAFIESQNLDEVVSSRDNLIKFYVDFHNKVNKRYGKSEWTVEQAKKHYS